MIIPIITGLACSVTVAAIVFWKRSNSLKYTVATLREMNQQEGVSYRAKIAALNSELADVKVELASIKDAQPQAQAEKPAKPKRKYYRKPKGPKA